MAYITTVCILHCGGDEEKHFIQYVEEAVRSYHGATYILEYRKYQENQDKAAVMYNDVQKYKQEKSPLIMLISKELFKVVWPTTHKQGILNVVTSYSTANCLHIWMDVKNEDVKRQSSALYERGDSYFKKIKASDLTNLPKNDMIKKIYDMISVNGDEKFNPLNNYAVDSEENELKRNFEKLTIPLKKQPQKAPQQKPAQKAKKKKEDVNKNALLAMNLPEEEQAEFYREIAAQGDSQGTQPSKRKKKKEKRKGTSTINLLSDLGEDEMMQISIYLGLGPGANWRQLAENLGYDANVLKDLVEDIPSGSEQIYSRRFLDILKTDKPGLEIQEFCVKCRQIMRTDVPDYLQTLMD